MDSQIKYYMHIQQIKKLNNEIIMLKKYKKECRIKNVIDSVQERINDREILIVDIIGIYDNMEYYYCTGNVENF